LSVWVRDHLVVIKIAGRANFASSVDFKTLIQRLRAEGYLRFVLDLSECLLMDSTFLGVLAGLGLRFSESGHGLPAASIELLRPNLRISDLLENLGVAHLFQVLKDQGPSCDGLQPVATLTPAPNAQELPGTILDAHRTLMEIHPDNIPKFKDVAQFLAEDLKKKGE